MDKPSVRDIMDAIRADYEPYVEEMAERSRRVSLSMQMLVLGRPATIDDVCFGKPRKNGDE